MEHAPIPTDIQRRAAVFPSMTWPQQIRLLDEINERACRIGGKTWGEAQRARQPLGDLHRRLRKLHDAQVAAWVAEGSADRSTTP